MNAACNSFVFGLSELGPNDDLESQLYVLTDALEGEPDPSPVFPAIFDFFEKFPDADFGSPGALVHFIEQHYPAYLSLLTASLTRHPTAHTLWMLNRILNSRLSPELRSELLTLLKSCQAHPSASEGARSEAQHYYARQLKA